MDIALTRGYIALVDGIDLDLSELNWYTLKSSSGIQYAARHPKVGVILMHRIILERMLGRPLLKEERVDHINHDTLDNRRENLRLATVSRNAMNQYPQNKSKSSKFKGVSWHSKLRLWRSRIQLNGKRISLGCFSTETEAALAYNKAAQELFGEYALLNEVN